MTNFNDNDEVDLKGATIDRLSIRIVEKLQTRAPQLIYASNVGLGNLTAEPLISRPCIIYGGTVYNPNAGTSNAFYGGPETTFGFNAALVAIGAGSQSTITLPASGLYMQSGFWVASSAVGGLKHSLIVDLLD